MTAKVLMVQGTSSSAGKSLLVAALCRIFTQEGYRVAPFKAQNMALNSFVTRDGLEIGRAQAVQAHAAGIEPTVDMNPILLKPEADSRSQVVVLGRPRTKLESRDYNRRRDNLWQVVIESLARLRGQFDLVVIEGAGSPAEPNLKTGDIVNMRVARHAQAPVLLVGDIDRGGVFASLVGTLELLEPDERNLLKGIIINKFRGDLALLRPGLDFLEARCGVPVVGVVPYLRDLRIAEEDSVALEQSTADRRLLANVADIAIIRLPHISNFDDFDPLALEPGVRVRYVDSPLDLGEPHAIIIPGSKSTAADLHFLNASGLATAIVARAHQGTAVVGICGGYQMLGLVIRDPDRVESEREVTPGLGLLPVETVFFPEKATYQAQARVVTMRGFLRDLVGQPVNGYEIHMGRTASPEPMLCIVRRGDAQVNEADGATDATGRIFGTYLHGLFDNAHFRKAWLSSLQDHAREVGLSMAEVREQAYNRLAACVRASLNMPLLYRIVGLPL
ncbi:MAG: cobyric acid synthase [Chloroflexi bacterium]|nr:cobyric acid synthase [Chloroflexota bacterium]